MSSHASARSLHVFGRPSTCALEASPHDHASSDRIVRCRVSVDAEGACSEALERAQVPETVHVPRPGRRAPSRSSQDRSRARTALRAFGEFPGPDQAPTGWSC
jgi:hypothetical protein